MSEGKALTVFTFQGHNLQVIAHNGEPWFIGKEVCDALGIANSRDAIARLSPHQRDDVGIADAIGRIQQTNIISEGGVYKLAFRSRKKEAEEFTDLVVDTILPSIRKTGKYAVPRQLRLPGTRKPYLPERGYHISIDRVALTPEQERKLLIEYVERTCKLYGGITANTLANSFVKRFSTEQALQRLEEAAHAGQLEHFYTPHTRRSGGKFKPARNDNDNIA